jgi:proteasome lid subunit RPN8/RPN11
MPDRITFAIPEEVPEDFVPGQPLFQSSEFVPPPLETAEAIPEDAFYPPPLDTAEVPGVDRGFLEQRKDTLKRGIVRAEQMAGILGAMTASKNIRDGQLALDKVQAGDLTARQRQQIQQNVQAVLANEPNATPERVAELEQQFLDQIVGELQARVQHAESLTGERIKRVAKGQTELEGIPVSDAMRKFEEAEGVGATIKTLFTSPAALDFAIESLPASAPGIVGGAIAGTALGPAGTAAGAFAGATLPETAARILEVMQELEVDLDQPDQVFAFINDPQKRAEAIDKGLAKGLTIGAISAFFAGFGGRLLSPAIQSGSAPRIAGAAVAEGVIQTAGEGIGEATALAASGAELDAKEIIAEMAGGGPTNIQEVLTNTLNGLAQARQRTIDPAVEAVADATEDIAASSAVVQEAQAAEQELRTSASQIGDDSVETVSEADLTDPDEVAAAQRAITEQTNQALETHEQVQQAGLDAVEQGMGAFERQQAAIDQVESQEAQDLNEAEDDVQNLKVYFDTAAALEATNPEAAAMMRFPRAAQEFETGRDTTFAGNQFVEIENEDGTRQPAVFFGYLTEDSASVGIWNPQTQGFTQDILAPGQRIATPIPSFEEWTAQQETATDAISQQEAERLPEDQPAEGLQPLEEEIRDEGAAEEEVEVIPPGNIGPEGLSVPISPTPTTPGPQPTRTPATESELANVAFQRRAERGASQARLRRLAKIAQPPTGDPDIISAIQDFGGIPAPRRQDGLEENRRFRDAFPGSTRFLINTNGKGTRYGPGGIDGWLQEFLGEHPEFAPRNILRYTEPDGSLSFGVDAQNVEEFLDQIGPALERRKTQLEQLAEAADKEKLEAAMFDNEKRRKRARSEYTANTDTLSVGDEFRVDGERFVVIDITPEGEPVIQDGITYRMPDGTEFYPDRGTLFPIGRRNQLFFTPEQEQELLAEEAAQEELDRGLGSAPRTQAEIEFLPPPLETAEEVAPTPEAEPQLEVVEEAEPEVDFGEAVFEDSPEFEAQGYQRFIPAAEWAIAEEARRRANPQSVLDVAPEGFVVPLSEIRNRYPELFEGRNAIDNRADLGRAMDEVRARQTPTRRRRRPTRQQEIQDLLEQSGLEEPQAEFEVAGPTGTILDRYPEFAAIVADPEQGVLNQYPVEVRNADGTIEPAVFNGFMDLTMIGRGQPASIGFYRPDADGISHGLLAPDAEVITPLPTPEEFNAGEIDLPTVREMIEQQQPTGEDVREDATEFGEDPTPETPSIAQKRRNLRPEISDILPNALVRDLPLAELQKLKVPGAVLLTELYKNTPTNQELQSIAELGAAGRHWYDDYRAFMRSMGVTPEQDFLLSGVLAATSPNKSVAENVRLAMNILTAWNRAGQPKGRDEILNILKGVQPTVAISDRNNTVAVLQSQDFQSAIGAMSDQSRKVKPFYRALMGDKNAVVIDTHIARLFGLRQSKVAKPNANRALTASVTNIARRLGWTPAETQAAMWAVARHYSNRFSDARRTRIGGPRPVGPILAEPVTNEILHRDDDIATILSQTYGEQLTELGFNAGSGARELARVRAARPADVGAGAGRTLSPRHQRSFGRRLRERIDDDLARTRGEQVADDRIADTAAEYADSLGIETEERREGAEQYATETLTGAQESGIAYQPDLPVPSDQVVTPDTDPDVETFLTTGDVTPDLQRRIESGERITGVLAEHVSGNLPEFNIDGQTIGTTQDFVQTQLALRSPYQESLKYVFLDQRNRVVHSGVASLGSIDAALIDPRILAKEWAVARQKGSRPQQPRLIISHNHPSGQTTPSVADITLQRRVRNWLSNFEGGELVDFVVTNGDTYYSSQLEMSVPLVEPHRAPWEVVPARARRKISDSMLLNQVVASVRQGNPDAEFVLYVDNQNRIVGMEQMPPDFTPAQWAATASEGAGISGAAGVFFITRKNMNATRDILTRFASSNFNIIDVANLMSDSLKAEGMIGESSNTTRSANVANESEAEYQAQVSKASAPFPVVPPPAPPPPSASSQEAVDTATRGTGTAPDSAVRLAQNYPATEVAQWIVSDPSAQDREAIDAEGLALLQNTPAEGRRYVPTRVFGKNAEDGKPFTVLGRRGGPDERIRAIQRAARLFADAGLRVQFDEQNEVYRLANPTAPQEEQGRELIRLLRAELAKGSADGSPLLSTMINSIRNPDGGLWVSEGFSESVRNELFSLAQAEASFYGLMLGALNKSKRSLNFVAKHVNVYLSKAYSDAFGGDVIAPIIDGTNRAATGFATDELNANIPEGLKGVLDRLDTAAQQGVDLDYFMGQVLDLIGRGERTRTPDPELAQLPSLFDLANWRLFITQRGGNRLAQNILRMINGQETDQDGAIEGSVKRMDRLLQADLNRIVKEVIPQIAKERQEPNFLQDLMNASGDLQTRTERLDVVDAEVRRGLADAEQAEMNQENADPDEIADKYAMILEKWDEQFTQISGTLSSDAMARRILNQQIRPVFERLSSNWSDVVKGRITQQRLKDLVMAEVEREFDAFNDLAPESAIDPARRDAMISMLDRQFDVLARNKIQNIRAQQEAAKAKRAAELPQRTAEGELNRLAQLHSDVQQWTVPETNAVRVAIQDQRKNPAEPEVFADTLRSLGVNRDTATTLSRIVNRDIDQRRRHEQLRREQRVASPRPERGKQSDQERKIGIRGLVERIFAVPPRRQNDPRWQERTALEYFKENGLTPEEAQDAWNHFKTDFIQLARQSAIRGLEQMRKNLTNAQRSLLNKQPKGKQLFERLQRAINAGVFHQEDIMKEFAKEFGWSVPTEAQIDQLKGLAEREQTLSSLTEDEIAQIGRDNTEALEAARIEKAAGTLNERLRLQNQIHTLYAQFSRPITFRTPEGRRNLAEAGREFISANMLLKLGFGVKQIFDVSTQFAVHWPLRGVANAWNRQKQNAEFNAGEFWSDVSGAITDSMTDLRTFAGQSVIQFTQAMRGEGVRRNIEGMRSTIQGFDRLRNKVASLDEQASELRRKGGPANLSRAAGLNAMTTAMKIAGLAEFALKFTRAMDNIQGVFVEQQGIRERVISDLKMNGEEMSASELRVRANEILLDWKREQDLALARAKEIADINGIEMTPVDLQATAYEIYKSRQYTRMKGASLDANDISESAQAQRQTVGWNMPEDTGVGGVIGGAVRGLGRLLEGAGIPLPLGQFSNAIAIGINRGLTWTPVGYFPFAFGGVDEAGVGRNAWFRTPTDRIHRKLEASIGTLGGSTLFALAAAGLIRVWTKPPDDPEERELWQKEGHRAGTVEFMVGDGKFIPISLTSGPMSLVRVPLTAIGAVQDVQDRARQRRKRVEAEAAAKGLEIGEFEGPSRGDYAAAASLGAFSAIMGGRTAGGALRSLRAGTDRDLPTLKTTFAAQASPFLPGLPAFQEIQRAREIRLDPAEAGVIDLMFPTQGSGKRRYNFLSDELGPGFDQQLVQTLTGGSFGVVDPAKLDEDNAYRIFRKIDYRPSPLIRNKGVFINGQIRPLTDEEYRNAQFQRGKRMKEMLQEIDPEQDPRILTRWASHIAEVTKKEALQSVQGEEITVESIDNRAQLQDQAVALHAEIMRLPEIERQEAFNDALAEGRIPFQNGNVHPDFLAQWRVLTKEIEDPASR